MTKPLAIRLEKAAEPKAPSIFDDQFPEPVRFKEGAIAANLKIVAETLGIDRAWLLRWLNRHPSDENGKAFYRGMGNVKLFSLGDYQRLCKALAAERGTIYFASSGEYVKIGFTRSVSKRIKKYSTENPLPTVLLHSEPGTFETENLTHRRFAHLRVHHEWFRKTQELLDYIEERKRLFADQEQKP